MSVAQTNGMHAVEVVGVGREPTLRKRRLLGDLLVKDGLISEVDLEAALRVQRDGESDATLGDVLLEQRVITEKQLHAALDRYHKKYRLGDLLVETGAITDSQLEIALDHHRKTGLRLGEAILQLNFATEERLKTALCTQLGITFVDLDKLILDRSVALLVGKEYAQRHRVIPVTRTDQTVTVAVRDPADTAVLDDLEGRLGCQVRIVTSTDASFDRAFTRAYGESPEAGLARQHAEQGKAYATLRREHEEALSALTALRGAHEGLLQERQATTRLLAEQRTRNEWNTHALAELRNAQDSLRRDYEAAIAGTADEAGAAAALATLQAEHGTLETAYAELQASHDALRAQVDASAGLAAAERMRGEERLRMLDDLRLSDAALRREVEESATALRALGTRHAERTRALADLEAAHVALGQAHEQETKELKAECDRLRQDQTELAAALEAVVQKLRG
jgi:hypothetical protein